MNKRKCVGCNQLKSKDELIKITRENTTAKIVLNPDLKTFGRSAYLCYNNSCIEAAFKKNKIQKALKAPVPPELKGNLTDELRKNPNK